MRVDLHSLSGCDLAIIKESKLLEWNTGSKRKVLIEIGVNVHIKNTF